MGRLHLSMFSAVTCFYHLLMHYLDTMSQNYAPYRGTNALSFTKRLPNGNGQILTILGIPPLNVFYLKTGSSFGPNLRQMPFLQSIA